MKKLLILLIFMFGLTATAQEVGVRFGEVARNNVAIDAVFNTSASRIHANASFGNNGVGVDVLWDFIFRQISGESFYWYAGVGPSMNVGDDDFYLGASGEIGLEYRFNSVPIAIGLDYRPTFWIVEDTDFEWGGFGLNARWIFGK
ncbi:outer membrane insertion C- signal [Aureitalea marina]|uniref:Outer membrane insertion C-signal n=1 Tax=Aureitalea marina TaxID=930804 RepID=A0A2S7KMH2_9FLAO|nr:outer membrane insertion C- signal [Aureitalea marina]PQB03798.1 outer membrane insertion C- signal [Aureitalea marina]